MSLNRPYTDSSQLPDTLPMFPLKGVLLLPRADLPLSIFEPRYLAMTDAAIRSDRLVGMIQPSVRSSSEAESPDLESIGCVGRITQFGETGDGRYVLTLTGIARFRVLQEVPTTTLYRQCRVSFGEFSSDLVSNAPPLRAKRDILHKALETFERTRGLAIDWTSISETPDDVLVTTLAMKIPFGSREKQALLEAPDTMARAAILIAIAEMELATTSGVSNRLQ